MGEEYTLQWEQVVGARIVKKEKFFSTPDKRDKFRRELMQRKNFFRLLYTKDKRSYSRK